MAIAFGGALGRNSGNSNSPSLAVSGISGSDTILILALEAEANGTTVTTPPSLGGNNFTQIATYVDIDDGAQMQSLWYLKNPPASGTINVGISNSTPWAMFAVYYTGVDQTTPTANETTFGNTPSYISSSPYGIVRQSNADGSWHIASGNSTSGSVDLNATAGGVRREAFPASGNRTQALLDSNAAFNNGDNSTITIQFATRVGIITCMLRPSGPPPPVLAISGVVTLSGSPVEGAIVRCIRQSDNTALAQETTDENGAYIFEDLEEGELYHLAVEYESGETKYNALSLWDVAPYEVE